MENEQKETQPVQNINVTVDPETYLEITIAKCENDIAEAEFIAAQANLKVYDLKRTKTKAIVDYHYRKLKQQQELQNRQAEMLKQSENVEAESAQVESTQVEKN